FSIQPRLDDGLEQIAQHSALAGADVDLGDHAGPDRQGFPLVLQVVALSADQNQVEGLPAAGRIRLDGVGANLLHQAIKVAVDGVVVGSDLDAGRHARGDEGDVL